MSCKAESIIENSLTNSIDEIDAGVWNRLVDGQTLLLQRDYLRAIENGDCEGLATRYALFSRAGRPVGVASFQITDFVGAPIGPLLVRKTPVVSFLARRLGLTRDQFSLRVIVCGNAFTSGEHGFYFLPEIPVNEAVSAMVGAALQIQSQLKQSAGILFKDFYSENMASRALQEHNFVDLQAEPTMILPLSRWRSFDDYLGDLASKYRVKARRAYAKSAELEVRELNNGDLARYSKQLQGLYDQVLERADFRLGRLGLESLSTMKREMPRNVVLRGYFLGDRPVGFLAGLIDRNTLDAHAVGIDYAVNRRHSIYPRMLYDYLQIGLERGLAQVDFGRTASEIKSTLGATPRETTCYLRHRGPIVNRVLPLLMRSIRPTREPLRKPFKRASYQPALIPQPELAGGALR